MEGAGEASVELSIKDMLARFSAVSSSGVGPACSSGMESLTRCGCAGVSSAACRTLHVHRTSSPCFNNATAPGCSPIQQTRGPLSFQQLGMLGLALCVWYYAAPKGDVMHIWPGLQLSQHSATSHKTVTRTHAKAYKHVVCASAWQR